MFFECSRMFMIAWVHGKRQWCVFVVAVGATGGGDASLGLTLHLLSDRAPATASLRFCTVAEIVVEILHCR